MSKISKKTSLEHEIMLSINNEKAEVPSGLTQANRSKNGISQWTLSAKIWCKINLSWIYFRGQKLEYSVLIFAQIQVLCENARKFFCVRKCAKVFMIKVDEISRFGQIFGLPNQMC